MDCLSPELPVSKLFPITAAPDEIEKEAHPPENQQKFTSIKTASVASQLLLFAGSLLLLVPIVRQIILFFLPKGFSKERQNSLQLIEERKVEVMNRCFTDFKEQAFSVSQKDVKDPKFQSGLKTLFTDLEKNENSLKVQQSLKEIYETETYLEMKAKAVDNPLLSLLQNLGTALRTDVVGMDILRNYGKAILEREMGKELEDREYSWHEMGNFTVNAFNHTKAPSFDTPFEMGFFLLQDFKSLFRSLKIVGLFGYSPVEDFNPYERGNFNLATMDYSFEKQAEKKEIRFFHGPGPGVTSDRMLSLQMEGLKANKNGFHLQHSMEYYNKPGENQRLHQLKTYEDDSEGRMRLFVTPVDGDIWHMKNDFAKWDTAGEFLAKYKEAAVRGEEGKKGYRTLFEKEGLPKESFYIGKDVMSDEQFEASFDLAADILEDESLLNNPYWLEMTAKGEEGKKVLAKGIQVFVQALTSMGALAKLANETNSSDMTLTFGQACMEDIDRGAVVNVATRLLMMRLSGQKINASILSEVIGTTLGRAELSSGRRIMLDRFEGLAGFIFLIGCHPEDKVDDLLKSHFQKMFFDNEAFKASVTSLN